MARFILELIGGGLNGFMFGANLAICVYVHFARRRIRGDVAMHAAIADQVVAVLRADRDARAEYHREVYELIRAAHAGWPPRDTPKGQA